MLHGFVNLIIWLLKSFGNIIEEFGTNPEKGVARK